MKQIITLIYTMLLTTQCLAGEPLTRTKEHTQPLDKLHNALKKSLRADNKPSKELLKKQADDVIVVYGGEDIKKQIEPSSYQIAINNQS